MDNAVAAALGRATTITISHEHQWKAKRLLGEFLSSSKLPSLDDLQGELECHICRKSYLTEEEPEFHISLRNCGHIVGSNVRSLSDNFQVPWDPFWTVETLFSCKACALTKLTLTSRWCSAY